MNRFEHLTDQELNVLCNAGNDEAMAERVRRGKPTQMPHPTLLLAALRAGFEKDGGAFNGAEGEAWVAYIGEEGYMVLDVTDNKVLVEVGDEYGQGDPRQFELVLRPVRS